MPAWAGYLGSVVSGAALVAPSGNRSALEPAVALLFELVEAPGAAALGELVPMSLHAPSAAAAASASVAMAIFSKCICVCHLLSPARPRT